jgi:glycosyltransferase involved in cell wall biosynthesis
MSIALLIPAYNAATHLPRLLKSAADQTKPFDEIWVYDDCSTDDTSAVAKKLGAKVVRGEANRGCTFGKSMLAQHATCDWIHFHDADDLLLPNFMDRALEWVEELSVDVVIFGCEERLEDTSEILSVTLPNDIEIVGDPIAYAIEHKINAISGLYRRDAFLVAGGFDSDPDVLFNEDQACHCWLARAGLKFRADPTVTVVNLRRRSSMWTTNQDRCLRAHFHVLRKALAATTEDRHRKLIAERLWHVVAGSASFLDWRTADQAALLAIELASPLSAPTGYTFKALCSVSPRFALRVREGLIRLLKSRYRENYPGWRAPVSLF